MQIALHLASGILQNDEPTQYDLDLAGDYLEIAMTSESLESQLIASNLVPLVEQASIKLTSAPTETVE